MALINKLTDIADAIRRKNGETAKYTLPQMVTKIDAIGDGSDLVQDTLTRSAAITFGNGAFQNLNKKITSIELPQATTFGSYAFSYCSSLTSVSLPQATTFGTLAFYNCTGLTTIELPNATTFNAQQSFHGCTNLQKIVLPKVEKILGPYFCANCTSLTAFVIGNEDAVVSFGKTGQCFDNTPIRQGTGYIYVPDALVESYQNNEYWRFLANHIKPLSDLPAD